MNEEPAVFSAVYSDWKLVRTRSTVQIVFEIPVEAAGHAYNVLGGMPDQSKSKYFGIAALDPSKVKA
jgi:hypothetical protein